MQIIRLNILVDVIRVAKARTSCEYLPIDTKFVSIMLLVSYFFHGLFSPNRKAKANYKAKISVKLVTSGLSDVATASVHSEKNRLKKLIMMASERSERDTLRCVQLKIGDIYDWASKASPTLGCSIEISRDIYIAYYTSKSGIWLVISRVASYFHEPKASANTAYE